MHWALDDINEQQLGLLEVIISHLLYQRINVLLV